MRLVDVRVNIKTRQRTVVVSNLYRVIPKLEPVYTLLRFSTLGDRAFNLASTSIAHIVSPDGATREFIRSYDGGRECSCQEYYATVSGPITSNLGKGEGEGER